MSLIRVTLADGPVEVPRGTTPREILASLDRDAQANAVAARVTGEQIVGGEQVIDLDRPLDADVELEFLTFDDEAGREVYRHSAAHVLAQAVKRLFPEARLAIGPPIEEGFYYDFDVARPFTPEDLEAIEGEMQAIIKADYPIHREAVEPEAARHLFRDLNEQYKLEILDELPPDEPVSLYRQGEFVDLCRGPHLPSTGRLRAVKLLHAAGAYWRGDERNPMLQRIYGTAFESRADLDAYLKRLEEARRRDHRRLGRDLDLYSIHDEVGPGLVLWHPNGGIIRHLAEDFARQEHLRRGYGLVYSPHIANRRLWEISGHWDWYKENMYTPIDIDGVEYLLKPMNCPFHMMIYRSRPRSYKELPLRWAEWGTVYRYERSGVLHGLLRVRAFTQDDAHIFCREDQVEEVIQETVDFARDIIEAFGFHDYHVRLSLRDPETPEKYVGSDAIWERAEPALAGALDRMSLEYTPARGEANFYGPKIDILIRDALGREWQGPTIQLDFNLPERFDLTYKGPDNRDHRPVMIHRALFGSMERFFGLLIEHHGGAFPVWLAPVQARVIPIGERHLDYARAVADRVRAAGYRVEVDERDEKVGYKIRQAQLEKVPYMLVVGDREQQDQTVALRHRAEGDLGPWPLAEILARLAEDLRLRR